MQLRQIIALFFVTTLTACSVIQSDVATFHKLPVQAEGHSVLILLGSEKAQASLEGQAYMAKLGERFTAAGFQVLRSDTRVMPTYFAVMSYGIDDGTLVTSNFSVPQWGVTGYSGGSVNGTVNGSTFNGTAALNPTYGVTGYKNDSTTSRIYKRALILNMYETAKIDNARPKSFNEAIVYETRVVSDGNCSSVAGVIDQMLDTIFDDFPGESGKTRTAYAPKVVNPLSGC